MPDPREASGPAFQESSFPSLWSQVEPVGMRASEPGYHRITATTADAEMREWFVDAAEQRGLTVVQDRAGNLWAWSGDPDRAGAGGPRSIVVGSHLDSVPRGGAFDGALGVASAFATVDELRRADTQLNRPLAVVAFVEEEGSRFGVTCLGSRVLTGALSASEALALRDDKGNTLAEALSSMGRRPDDFGADPEVVGRIGTYLELHIEQGRGLVDMDRSVGVAAGINAFGRWRLELPGEANHAGTTRLADRHDPMLTLAEVVLRARQAATRQDCVATVAKIDVEPNVSNAIPARVTAWLDARGIDASRVEAVVADLASIDEVTIIEESFVGRQGLADVLVGGLAEVLGDAPVLESGAAHDAGILAGAGIPSGMLFVRNPTGVSHSPEEHADLDDCIAGVRALRQAITAIDTGQLGWPLATNGG